MDRDRIAGVGRWLLGKKKSAKNHWRALIQPASNLFIGMLLPMAMRAKTTTRSSVVTLRFAMWTRGQLMWFSNALSKFPSNVNGLMKDKCS